MVWEEVDSSLSIHFFSVRCTDVASAPPSTTLVSCSTNSCPPPVFWGSIDSELHAESPVLVFAALAGLLSSYGRRLQNLDFSSLARWRALAEGLRLRDSSNASGLWFLWWDEANEASKASEWCVLEKIDTARDDSESQRLRARNADYAIHVQLLQLTSRFEEQRRNTPWTSTVLSKYQTR